MTDIRITPLEEGAFGVEVVEGDTATNHRVTVPPSLVDDLGLGGLPEEDLVRESIEFLLERERATSILGDFALDTIERFFPGYGEELPRRLGR